MRIIFVTGKLIGGGAERVLVNLANQFSINNNVAIVQLIESESYKINKNIKIYKYKKGGKNSLIRFYRKRLFLKKSIKDFNANIVISFMSLANILTIMSRVKKTKIIISERNDPSYIPQSRLLRYIRNIVYHFSDGYVFQTEDAKKYFSRSIQQKATVIKNPILSDLPEVNIIKNKNKIVMAGRLEPVKNYDLAIDAFAKVIQKFPQMQLEIYGDGSERNKLENRIKKMNLGEKICIHGFSTEWHNEASDAKIYLLSSNHEGMSNSLIEAMAMGIPSISTDHPIGGAKDLIINYKNGILVPTKDVDKMVNAIIEIVENISLAQEISENGKKLRKQLSIEKISKEWIEYCRKV